MSELSSLHHIPLSELAQRCARETERFYQSVAYDPRYCFEIFHRAVVERDERAMNIFVEQYRSQVASWVRRHDGFPHCGESLEDLVSDVFEKIWVTFTSDKHKLHKFPTFQSLMSYLQMCVHSVIADAQRLNQRFVDLSNNVSIEPERDRPATQHLWDEIFSRLKDEKERLVITALFVYEMTPRELYTRVPHRFRGVDEIYLIKQNVIARLRRDSRFKDLFGEDD